MSSELIAGLVGAGAGFGASSLTSGKGSAPTSLERTIQGLSEQSAQAGGQLLGETALTRKLVLAPIEATLLGMRPTQLPVFAPAREALESQFKVARENVIGTTPARGGQLNQALIDLEQNRAKAVAGVESDLAMKMFDTGAQIGFGAVPAGTSGLSQAVQGLSGIAQAQTARETGKGAGMGGLLGNIILATALKGSGTVKK